MTCLRVLEQWKSKDAALEVVPQMGDQCKNSPDARVLVGKGAILRRAALEPGWRRRVVDTPKGIDTPKSPRTPKSTPAAREYEGKAGSHLVPPTGEES